MFKTEDWQTLINKPVISDDKGAIGVVTEIQPLHIIVSAGPITPTKYNIPKEMVNQFENGVIYLTLRQKDIEENYKFE
jgi:anthranilate/para-aminobenzoate synthase component II